MKSVHYELSNGVKIVRLDSRQYQLLVGDITGRLAVDVARREIVYILKVARDRGIRIVEITRWNGSKYTEYPR